MMVLNESTFSALGWKDPHDAMGQQLRIPGDPATFTVKGVTQDFQFTTMNKGLK